MNAQDYGMSYERRFGARARELGVTVLIDHLADNELTVTVIAPEGYVWIIAGLDVVRVTQPPGSLPTNEAIWQQALKVIEKGLSYQPQD